MDSDDDIASLRARIASLQARVAEMEQERVALNALIDIPDGAAWVVDLDMRFVVGNARLRERARTLFGVTYSPGDDPLAAFSSADRERWRGWYARALGGEEYSLDAYEPLTGRHNAYTFRPLIRDGRVIGAGVVAVDMTEAWQAQKVLALANHVVETLPEGVSLVRDGDGTIVHANPAFHRMFGYEPHELHGVHASRLNATERQDPEQVASAIIASLREHGVWRGEVLNMRKDGAAFWTRASVTGSEHPEHGRVWVTMQQDITAERSVRAELARTKEILDAILDHAPLLISATDLQGRIVLANRRFAVLAGPAPEAMIGRDVCELFPAETVAALWRDPRAAYTAGEARAMEARVQHHGGAWRTYQTVSFPLSDEAGETFAVAAISADITERVDAEAERLSMQARRLEDQRLESLGVLAGGVAHDINNLLVPILMSAQLLTEDGVDVASCAAQIEAAARHVRDLVQQVLAYVGKGQVAPQLIDVGTLVEEMLTLLRASLPKTTAIELHRREGPSTVRAELGQLRQVVMNLALNASEALDGRAGSLRIEVGPAPAPLPDGRPAVSILIADDGPGIPPESVPRIFDPFFTTKATGRGLGLSAVQGIVRAHGGTLGLDTAVGRGTTFQIALPAVQVARREAPAQAPARRVAGRHGRVLVVDDETSVLSAVERVLTRAGHEVFTASSGEAALAAFTPRPNAFDVVLLDCSLPGWSGVETLGRLRAVRADIPVVMMSGWSAELADEVAGTLVAFMAKPFTMRSLRETIAAALATAPAD